MSQLVSVESVSDLIGRRVELPSSCPLWSLGVRYGKVIELSESSSGVRATVEMNSQGSPVVDLLAKDLQTRVLNFSPRRIS